jgi:transposase-like protein
VNFQEVVHSVPAGNADVARQKRFAEDRMDMHKNARLTPKGREEMVRAVVDSGLTKAAAARRFNTTPKTARRVSDNRSQEGRAGVALQPERQRPHISVSADR